MAYTQLRWRTAREALEVGNRKWYLSISKVGSIAIIGGLFIYFAVLMPDIWLTGYNLMNLIEQTVCLGLVALGLTFVCAAGENDLSVGSTASLASIISMGLIMGGQPIGVSVIISLFIGSLVGLCNGILRTKVRIPGVIPTIGTQSIVAGLAMIYNWGNMIFGSGPAVTKFCVLGRGYVGPISVPALILVLTGVLVWVLLNYTRFGRLIYMVGGNPEASRLSGVRVNRIVMLSYMVCGVLAAAAGVMMSARIGAGNPLGGNDLLLDGIIAVMLGGTILAEEQEFSPAGSLVGAFFVTLVMTGLQLCGHGSHVQCILRGVLLIVALALFSLQKRAAE